MQCERRAAREKRADVNPWLSGTHGRAAPLSLLLPPAPPGRRRAARSCEGFGGGSWGCTPAAATTCGAGLGAEADFHFAYVQLGASRAPGRPCSCKVTQPGTEAGAAASARTSRRPRQGEARAPHSPGAHGRPPHAVPGPGGRRRARGSGSAPGVRPTGTFCPRCPPAVPRQPGRAGAAERRRWWRGQPRSAVGRPPAAGRHLPAAATDVRASPAPAGSRLPPSFPPSSVTYITPWEGRLEHGCRGERPPPCSPCMGKGVQPTVRAGMLPAKGCFTSRSTRRERTPSLAPSLAPTLCFSEGAGGG